MSDFDPISKPKYYNVHPSGVEPIEIGEFLDYVRGNVIKYVWRAGQKGTALQDLQKAAWYLRRSTPENRRGGADLKKTFKVIAAEPEGSVLRDVLRMLFVDYPAHQAAPMALARVEREIERVQEGGK